jgi:hypothetical protein
MGRRLAADVAEIPLRGQEPQPLAMSERRTLQTGRNRGVEAGPVEHDPRLVIGDLDEGTQVD